MGDKTAIAWTDATLNAIRGCTAVSAGCDHCYAAVTAARFSGAGQAYDGLARRDEDGAHWTGAVKLIPKKLDEALGWERPRRVFVNSMSDLFYAKIPTAFVDRHFATFALAERHVFQVLTKRPERMARYLLDPGTPGRIAAQMQSLYLAAHRAGKPWAKHSTAQLFVERLWNGPLANVWLGTSVESNDVIHRVPHLLDCPAAVRFISAEPLLGALDLSPYLRDAEGRARLHWVIVGGESGPKFRPMNLDWARALRDDCARASVPYFFKQTGGLRPGTGETLDGVEHREYPS